MPKQKGKGLRPHVVGGGEQLRVAAEGQEKGMESVQLGARIRIPTSAVRVGVRPQKPGKGKDARELAGLRSLCLE